jgi:AcrR family transcriptional regulator
MEEIADASGVSLRTVFRYFPTKNDLFGYALGSYGDALVSALSAASPDLSPLELVRETSLAGLSFAASQPRLRLVMDITRRNRPARQAFATGLVEIEDRLIEAFTGRFKKSAHREFQPRMLAFLTQMGVSLALNSWVAGDFKEPAAAHRNVFAQLIRLCEGNAVPPQIKVGGSLRKSKNAARELETASR